MGNTARRWMVVSLLGASLSTGASAAELDRLEWIFGTWKRDNSRGEVYESWRRLSEHSGEGRSWLRSSDGEERLLEALLLVEMAGELFYIPKVAENEYPVPFRMTSVDPEHAVFENPTHDFPQKIIYRRERGVGPEGLDGLTVTIEGPGETGASSQVEFRFLRSLPDAAKSLAPPKERPIEPTFTTAADEFGPRGKVLETPWFTFFSDFGFNLYDAVLTSAAALRNQQADSFHDAECFLSLATEDRSGWDAAVRYYADTLAAASDFSRERTIVRAHLAAIDIALDDDDRRDLGLAVLMLRAAAPAWRHCRWQPQDVVNRRWIGELVPRLEAHAETIRPRLEALFGASWRRFPIPVDVVTTAGWAGADTSQPGGQTHIQISSTDAGYQGPRALEMIFHEASHELVSPRNGPIARLLASTAQELGVEVHRSLWHGLLFVTVGEVAKEVLDKVGEGPYQPVADEVFRGDWKILRQPLVEHWLPFVRGETSREEAARALLTALGK